MTPDNHQPHRGSKSDFTSGLQWRVTYSDGTVIWEQDKTNGHKNSIKTLQHDKIKYFDLVRPPTSAHDFASYSTDQYTKTTKGEPLMVTFKLLHSTIPPVFRVTLQQGQRLIFTRRRQMHRGQKIAVFGIKAKTVKIPFPTIPSGTIVIVGYTTVAADASKNTNAINFIFPDGTIELASEWGADAAHSVLQSAN